MRKATTLSRSLWIAIVVAAFVAIPVFAGMGHQSMMQSGDQDNGATQMSSMMQNMSTMMTGMSDRLSHGTLSDDARQQMADRMQKLSGMMKQMSGMMDHMSGMSDKTMMMSSDMQSHMNRMRRQMDEMMQNGPMHHSRS